VNSVAFSPDGLNLLSAGDGGVIILWAVPASKRGKGNGRYFWSDVVKESDLACKVVNASCEDIMDVSWAPDSKRFVVGSLDHSVIVFEQGGGEGEWSCVWRNNRDHVSYVQGVSWDPLGGYVASMGSDRVCRVWGRKKVGQSKKKEKKVLAESNGVVDDENATQKETEIKTLLTNGKFEVHGRSKAMKYREAFVGGQHQQIKKYNLFADESTVESFFRRLSWTTDGAFLVTPTALWDTGDENKASFATYLWGRHRFDKPMAVLSGLEKPSVVVRPCPTLFTIPKTKSESCKENTTKITPPYRSIFAVLTLDSVLLYDTFQIGTPIAIARGLHYAGLTDCTWTSDGRHLLVSSSDGYISVLQFAEGELGTVYTPKKAVTRPVKPRPVHQNEGEKLPPCPPGQSATIIAPPSKKIKRTIVPATTPKSDKEKKRITPVLVSTTHVSSQRVKNDDATDVVTGAVTDLSLEGRVKKKKKRIQPTLIDLS